MIYGDLTQLRRNEQSLKQYEYALLFMNLSPEYLSSQNATDQISVSVPPPINQRVVVRRTCFKLIDDLYCHWYFPQYRMTLTAQPPCREYCEMVRSQICKREFEIAEKFNAFIKSTSYPFSWNIIDCSLFPWQDNSRLGSADPECYHYDNVQGEEKTKPLMDVFETRAKM